MVQHQVRRTFLHKVVLPAQGIMRTLQLGRLLVLCSRVSQLQDIPCAREQCEDALLCINCCPVYSHYDRCAMMSTQGNRMLAQKNKHFQCGTCHKKLNTATALKTHCLYVHKEEITRVPNAKPGRDEFGYDVVGMAGMPGTSSDQLQRVAIFPDLLSCPRHWLQSIRCLVFCVRTVFLLRGDLKGDCSSLDIYFATKPPAVL